MEKVYIILQVRLSSSRLPQKILLPLKGISIFEHIITRLLRPEIPEGIIVATTEDTVPYIEEVIERYGVHLFVGSEYDVLARFAGAVRAYDASTVVRATGDNPLVCIDYIDRALELHDKTSADLTTFPLLPYGSGVEVIGGSVLEGIDRITNDPVEREHITQYLYRHESDFTVVRGMPEVGLQRPDIRLTVDTYEDYRRISHIYDALYRGMPIRLRDVISYLDRRV